MGKYLESHLQENDLQSTPPVFENYLESTPFVLLVSCLMLQKTDLLFSRNAFFLFLEVVYFGLKRRDQYFLFL